jgi:hypothetical protein
VLRCRDTGNGHSAPGAERAAWTEAASESAAAVEHTAVHTGEQWAEGTRTVQEEQAEQWVAEQWPEEQEEHTKAEGTAEPSHVLIGGATRERLQERHDWRCWPISHGLQDRLQAQPCGTSTDRE